MRFFKKEIDNLYFLDITSTYVVVNDQYQGILIMDHNLNVIKTMKLDNDITINQSITKDNKMLLFCYENECVFFIDLDLWKIKRIDMNMFPDIYLSEMFDWDKDDVYLLANSGETCMKISLTSGILTEEKELNNSEIKLKKNFKKLIVSDVCVYDPNNNSALVVQDSEYYLFDYKREKKNSLNIKVEKKSEENISSDMIYCKTDFISDKVIRICERNIQVISSGNSVDYLYPPYEMYRYCAGRIIKINDCNMIFALCNDNSCEDISLIIKYIL